MTKVEAAQIIAAVNQGEPLISDDAPSEAYNWGGVSRGEYAEAVKTLYGEDDANQSA